MLNDELILAETFCTHYSVNFSFVQTLHQMGLVELTAVEQQPYIHYDQLQKLEQLLRLHVDLDINPEGVDVVNNLLDKMRTMQLEINLLKSRLQLYEG